MLRRMETNDLLNDTVRDMIADAVYRGASKAIGVYLLVSAIIGIIFWLIASSGGE